LYVKGAFELFIAGLNGLAGVVMLKPLRQGRKAAIISILDQGGMLVLAVDLER
jgi:hypothetical protein